MRIRALAAGFAILGLAAGCSSIGSSGAGPPVSIPISSSAGQPSSIGSSAASPQPVDESAGQLTPAAALQVFATFLVRYRALSLQYSAALNDDITAGALNQEDAFGSEVRFPQFLFVAPGAPNGEHVYVPRLTAYPRWFVAMGTLNGDSDTLSVYVLVQARPSTPWQAVFRTSAPGLGPTETPVLDPAGYAAAVPLASSSQVAAPGQVASLYTRQLNSGSGSLFYQPFSKVSALTPGGNPVSEAASAKLGWQVSIQWAPYVQPAYALATRAGGAIVIFTVDQQLSWTGISAHPQLPSTNDPAVGQYYYAPWPQFASLAHVTSTRAGLRISLETIYDWLAVDPPAHSHPGVVVLAEGSNGFAGASAN
jgi:hypothetical protein